MHVEIKRLKQEPHSTLFLRWYTTKNKLKST